MPPPDAGWARRDRLVAGAKASVLLAFSVSLAYTAGASFRLFSTTLERWALSVGLTLLLAAFAVAIVADWLVDAVRESDE